MKTKTYSPEQIVRLLREVEAGQSEGKTVEEVCRTLAISSTSYHRWKNQYGGMKTDEVRRLKELEKENERLKQLVAELSLDNKILKEAARGKLTGPARRREVVGRLAKDMALSQRRVCKALGVHRSGVRYASKLAARMPDLVKRLRELARKHPRYGYRRVTALLRAEGWPVNRKRVRRLWRLEGLKIPRKVKKKRRLGHSGNGCTRRAATRVNEVWSYDFVFDQTSDGRRLKILPVVDEYSRECVAMVVARNLTSKDVVAALERVAKERGMPGHLRSDNGPEFIAQEVKQWLARAGTQTLYIEPGSPWENAYSESFNSRLRDELLNGESFASLKEAQVLLGQWRRAYNEERPHSSLGYVAPAVFARNQPPSDGAKPRPTG